MSTITFRYPESAHKVIAPYKKEIRQIFKDKTAQVLGVTPESVIFDYLQWEEPRDRNAPDILIRAETSIKRRDLLRVWGPALLEAWQEAVNDLHLCLTELRVAAKPYVIDSEWFELEK